VTVRDASIIGPCSARLRSDTVREVASIPEDEAIMTCVALGYPDESFAANAVRSERFPAEAFVRYVGFD